VVFCGMVICVVSRLSAILAPRRHASTSLLARPTITGSRERQIPATKRFREDEGFSAYSGQGRRFIFIASEIMALKMSRRSQRVGGHSPWVIQRRLSGLAAS
jgi:hypothetical protein